jgi:molybdate/tungstate transport system substrate-binding protein
MRKIFYLLVALITCVGTSACGARPGERTPLRVLLAGSLMIPFDGLERAFEEEHPDVDVLMEGHGSIQCIRHVTELEELADIVAVADEALIPLMMYQTHIPGTDQPYADWYLPFATNRLGIAYTSQSAYADEINQDNWYEVMSRPDLLLGLSDPRMDACGYRGLMVAQLAVSYYGEEDLFYHLLGDRFTLPVRVQTREGISTILVPEVLQPEAGKGLVMRGGSVQLLGLLESGDLDYAFEYESVARQHGLKFLALPPEIDLSDEAYEDHYARVRVTLAFRRFASIPPEFEGRPIVYGLTIPKNAPHPDLAIEFIHFLVGPEGQAVMEQHGHRNTQHAPRNTE